jgi:hypothetical protein
MPYQYILSLCVPGVFLQSLAKFSLLFEKYFRKKNNNPENKAF